MKARMLFHNFDIFSSTRNQHKSDALHANKEKIKNLFISMQNFSFGDSEPSLSSFAHYANY
jgi:hypothetical protein